MVPTDDTSDLVNPEFVETCGDSVDNDRDGAVDEPDAEGCVFFFKDVDGDGFEVTDDSQCLCAPTGLLGHTGGDCDVNALMNPGEDTEELG